MKTVDEKSTAWLTVVPNDKDGQPEVPATLTYQVHDVDSGTEILAEAALSPALSVEITLKPTDNLILDDANQYERRRVTVKATFGVDDSKNDVYFYRVRNLKMVS